MSGLDSYERSLVEKKLEKFKGELADADKINSVVEDIHSSGQYESVHYYVDSEGYENVLTMHVEPSKKGPHFFRLGLFYEVNTNVHESYIFNLLMGLEFNDLFIEGDSLENEYEFFSGITATTRYFLPFHDYFFIRPEVKFRYVPDKDESLDIGIESTDANRTEMTVASSLSIGTFNRMFGEMSVGFMNEYLYYDYELILYGLLFLFVSNYN